MVEQNSPTPMDEEQLAEHCLMLSQQLFQEGQIDTEQREMLKQMIFDEDAKLFGFCLRYSEESELEELKMHIVAYVTQQ